MTEMTIWPETIKEAVEQMIDTMSEEDKMELVNTKPDSIYRFQYSLVLLICGWFGLYNGNKVLLADCANTRKNEIERIIFLYDPEKASVIIIEEIRKRLRTDLKVPV
jgi:hypothetical protein